MADKFSTILSSTSVWAMREDADVTRLKSGLSQLSSESDRAVAVVGGAIVELILTAALKAFLHQHAKIITDNFRSEGALGAFGTKIDLGLLIGMYGQEAWRDLVTMKDIRNAFAHRLDVEDFQSQKIRGWCENLKLVEKHTQSIEPEWHGSFHVSSPGEAPPVKWLGVQNRTESLANPRVRFLLSAQVMCIGLANPTKCGMPTPLF